MNSQEFLLQPFETEAHTQKFQLKGLLQKTGRELFIKSDIIGPLEQIILPKPSGEASQTLNLWENTCFEVFIGASKTNRYWEWNLSPNLNWNLFQFKDYRNNENESLEGWSHRAERLLSKNHFQLKLELELPPPLTDLPLEVGIAYVLHHKQEGLSHWAIQHLSRRADFHNRGSFLLKI